VKQLELRKRRLLKSLVRKRVELSPLLRDLDPNLEE